MSAPIWIPFGVNFHVFSRSNVGWLFDGICSRLWTKMAPKNNCWAPPFSLLFDPGPQGVFLKVPWLTLAPFWLNCGCFWYLFGSILISKIFPFGSRICKIIFVWKCSLKSDCCFFFLWKNFLGHFQQSIRRQYQATWLLQTGAKVTLYSKTSKKHAESTFLHQ